VAGQACAASFLASNVKNSTGQFTDGFSPASADRTSKDALVLLRDNLGLLRTARRQVSDASLFVSLLYRAQRHRM